MRDSFLEEAIQVLRQELREVDYAIRTLESLSTGHRRRGRPPKFLAAWSPPHAAGKRRPPAKVSRP